MNVYASPQRAALRVVACTFLFLTAACASNRPASLAVKVTSEPARAEAVVKCPSIPGQHDQHADTPARFHVPADFVRCEVEVSKEGFTPQRVALSRDMLRPRGNASAERFEEPIRFERGAGPFSVLGALLHRWFDRATDRMSDRMTSAITPDLEVHVKLGK